MGVASIRYVFRGLDVTKLVRNSTSNMGSVCSYLATKQTMCKAIAVKIVMFCGRIPW